MKKAVLAVVGAVVLAVVFSGCKGPDLKQFEPLKDPQIKTMPDQRMISIELKGEPDKISPEGIGAIYKMYFRLKDVPKKSVAPRARWPVLPDIPKDQWIGIFGVPVPDSIEELPDQKDAKVKVELKTWKYGEVAEILHIGAYDKETPTVEKLHTFIKEKGYKIAGPHEEEYIKGPGMIFKGDPNKYYTIIRYQIEKAKVEKKSVKTDKKKSKKKK